MTSLTFIDVLGYLDPITCLVALALLYRRRLTGEFRPLVLLLATRVVFFCVGQPMIYLARSNGQWHQPFYHAYFYLYWLAYTLETVLGFFVIFSVFSLAMAPLQGLERLGRLMFRWAGGIAIALALTTALGPHATADSFAVRAVIKLQQTQSILTLCMLFFVCLAIRPMGLSHRSRIFGVCLGLGVMATSDLVGSAWLGQVRSMQSIYDIVNGASIVLAVSTWIGYFIIPEPKRRMIVLPTTSPFLRWNQISVALGDEPGFVAVGEVTPDMFAPAEVEIMRRATMKMRMPSSARLAWDDHLSVDREHRRTPDPSVA